jgi:hypothetical protein
MKYNFIHKGHSTYYPHDIKGIPRQNYKNAIIRCSLLSSISKKYLMGLSMSVNVFHHIDTSVTLNHIVTTVTLDTIVAFDIPLVALPMSPPAM